MIFIKLQLPGQEVVAGEKILHFFMGALLELEQEDTIQFIQMQREHYIGEKRRDAED